LNVKSIVLEGSRETSGGERVPLDLSDVKDYSLFPGQVIKNTSSELCNSYSV